MGADPAFVASQSSQQAVSTKGFNPGEGLPGWAAGSLTAAKFELKRLERMLGNEPFGASKISIYAADLYALIAAIEQMSEPRLSTGEIE